MYVYIHITYSYNPYFFSWPTVLCKRLMDRRQGRAPAKAGAWLAAGPEALRWPSLLSVDAPAALTTRALACRASRHWL